MSKGNSEYEFYVGEGTHLEGASLDIHGTARIDGTFVGKISVKHLIVGENGSVTGDISGETALVEGVIEDTLTLSGKLEVTAKGKIRGKIISGGLLSVRLFCDKTKWNREIFQKQVGLSKWGYFE